MFTINSMQHQVNQHNQAVHSHLSGNNNSRKEIDPPRALLEYRSRHIHNFIHNGVCEAIIIPYYAKEYRLSERQVLTLHLEDENLVMDEAEVSSDENADLSPSCPITISREIHRQLQTLLPQFHKHLFSHNDVHTIQQYADCAIQLRTTCM